MAEAIVIRRHPFHRRNRWVQASTRYLLSNNFAGVPDATITRLKQT